MRIPGSRPSACRSTLLGLALSACISFHGPLVPTLEAQETESGTTETQPTETPTTESESAEPSETSAGELEEDLETLQRELEAIDRTFAGLEERLRASQSALEQSTERSQELADRAQLATDLAEARLALQSLPPATDAAATERIQRIDVLLDTADEELSNDNVGNAQRVLQQAATLLDAVAPVERNDDGPPTGGAVSIGQLRTLDPTNLRRRPALTSDRISVLRKGALVRALARNGEWYEVETGDGQRGWVHSRLVEELDDVHADEPGGWITTALVNVRQEPDLEAARLGRLEAGTVVRSLERSGVWHRVDFFGSEGWVHGDYLRRR